MDSADRSLPRHSKNGAKKSRANSVVDARLSVIAEDGAVPTVPEKSRNNRTFSRGWAFNPPRHSFEESPPNYSFWDVTGPKGEKLTDVRNNKYIAQRGGWRRICLIFFVLLAVILALAIGLGVGLHKKHTSRYVDFTRRLYRIADVELGIVRLLRQHQHRHQLPGLVFPLDHIHSSLF